MSGEMSSVARYASADLREVWNTDCKHDVFAGIV